MSALPRRPDGRPSPGYRRCKAHRAPAYRRDEVLRRARARRRRGGVLAALYALLALPVLLAGLWGTGEYGSAWYGVAGVVLALLCLWWSEVLGRWMP